MLQIKPFNFCFVKASKLKQKLTMKKILLFTLFSALATIIWAQPELDSWIMTTGFAQYSTGGPTVTMSDSGDVQQVCYNTNNVYVSATGLAGQYVMGPFPMNPNTPSGQNYVFRIDRTPSQETGTKTSVPLVGAVGVAVNGVVFYGYGDARSYNSMAGQNTPNGDGNWFSDAWVSEGATMDASGNGHPQQQGVYHYHANPITLYSDPSSTHSPIIGFAFDGFPIYGPFGYSSPMDNQSSIKRMESGYDLRSITDRSTLPGGSPSIPAGPAITVGGNFDLGTYIEDYEFTGNGDLDEYNGRWCVTPEYPGPVGTYAYFMSTDSNGDPKFPYLFAAEYYGEVTTTSTNNSIPGGVTCGVTSSISDLEMNNDNIIIYPNPANDVINISSEDAELNGVLVSNSLGQLIIETSESRIDISTLPIGIYNVTLLFDNNSITKRFVKN